MSEAIETLMTEHRLIEKVLGSLQTFASQLEPGQSTARKQVADYAEFFREFADRCHHGKEEDRLFGVMIRHGFPTSGGPIAVMLQEHEIGRAHVRALAQVGEGDGDLSAEEIATVKSNAASFFAMLSAHIQKEDGILFPAADRVVPEPVLGELAGQFEEFDASSIGAETLQRLHGLAEALIAKTRR
jgi:hemerythrin-like domain-containing protein